MANELAEITITTPPEIIRQQSKEIAARQKTVDDCQRNRAHLAGLLKDPRFKKKLKNNKGLQVAVEICFRWLERRAGQILKEMAEKGERQTAADGRPKATHNASLPTKEVLGIQDDDAVRWQLLATIPEPKFEEVLNKKPSRAALLRLAKELQTVRWKYKPVFEIADLRNLKMLPCGKVDLIITDPPYGEKYLDLYLQLGKIAYKSLQDGGSLLCMTGQSYLPQIYGQLEQSGLIYQWTFAYLTPGGQSPQIWPVKVNTFWKPILWYVRGKYAGEWNGDLIKSDVNDNDKTHHEWGQSLSGMRKLLERISNPDAVIADPFCGGGTTGIAVAESGRRFYGYDINPEMVETAKERVSARS